MIRAFFHPRFKQLNRFADQELSGRKREGVAAHLAHCARCRETVRFVRGLSGSAAEIRVAGPPTDALERILRRRAAGDRVILPIATPPSAPSRVRRAGPYAAASVVVIAAAGLFTFARADRSELRLEPSAPRSGSEITAEYHGGMFEADERLRLRAEYHYADGRIARVIAAHLSQEEDGGLRSGSFRLPDSVVYALFAVEDVEAVRVDSNQRRLWDLLVYEDDTRPTFKALAAKMDDLVDWDWAEAHETAGEMVELYPEKVESWDRLLGMDLSLSSFISQGHDAPEVHREQFKAFEERFQQEARVEADDLAGLYYYAQAVGDPVAADFWRERLATEAPGHPTDVQIRAQMLAQELRGQPGELLTSMEELWQGFGPVHQEVATIGFRAATRDGNPQAVGEWARRLVELRPETRLDMARILLDFPPLRDEAMHWLREELRESRDPDHAGRSLVESMSIYEARQGESARAVLVAIGEGLVEAGEIRAGLDSIALAVEGGWDPALFRTAAETYLSAGDTAGAAPVFARIAADPATPRAYADSVRARLGSHFPETEWTSLVDRGREVMRQQVLAKAELRYLADEIPLVTAEGELREFRALSGGEIAVVAFWSRNSFHALADLPRLHQLVGDLEADDVRLIAITSELPSRTFERDNRELQIGFPIYHDVDGAAQRAFSQWNWPAYYVVDSRGRVRFANVGLDLAEIRRQVGTLRLTEKMPTVAM